MQNRLKQKALTDDACETKFKKMDEEFLRLNSQLLRSQIETLKNINQELDKIDIKNKELSHSVGTLFGGNIKKQEGDAEQVILPAYKR